MLRTSHTSWGRLLFVLLLIGVLPVFIWAVLTQRIELRKRASTSEPTQICWNRVTKFTNKYNWPNSCKGNPRLDRVCAEILVALTPQEAIKYSDWVNAGKPFIPGCQMTTPIATKINWTTPNVSLTADDLTLEVNATTFKGKPTTPIALHSDPGTYNYTTLEATWKEHNVEMRMYMYFTSDCTSGAPMRCNEWRVSEVRVYNGKSPGDWLVFKDDGEFVGGSRPKGTWGQPYTSPLLHLSSSGGGVHVLKLTNLRLQPFLSKIQPPILTPSVTTAPTICTGKPNGTTCVRCRPCTSQVCPAVCIQETAICMNGQCNGPTPTPKPSPTPKSSPTPTPISSCTSHPPSITVTPSNQNGHPGDKLSYTVTIKNGAPAGCATSNFTLSAQVAANWQYAFANTTIQNLTPGQQVSTTLNVTSASTAVTTSQSAPVTVRVTDSRTALQARTDVAYTVVPNVTQSVSFLVKIAGVTDDRANGAKIDVKFTKQNGTVVQLSSPLALAYTANGVYKATANLTNPFPADTKFRITIKGEKHSAIQFTHQTGQSNQCSDSAYITMPNPIPTSYTYDFTGVPLPAGDTAAQDGQVNQTDIDHIVTLMSTPSTNLTGGDKLVGDLNYDGTINGFDLFLILQTLRTRCDAT